MFLFSNHLEKEEDVADDDDNNDDNDEKPWPKSSSAVNKSLTICIIFIQPKKNMAYLKATKKEETKSNRFYPKNDSDQ